MPSTTSSSVSRLLASSTVMTPSLPTFCMASAIISPIDLSPLAEIVPTWATSRRILIFFERFGDVLDDFGDGQVDAALQVHRVHAGGDALGAFADDRLGQNGGGGGAVAGDVVGLRGDFAHHLRAHVLELVLELDFLGDGDAVLGDARARRSDLSMTTLRPLGPSVTFTALARMSTPRSILSRASEEKRTSLAAIDVSP